MSGQLSVCRVTSLQLEAGVLVPGLTSTNTSLPVTSSERSLQPGTGVSTYVALCRRHPGRAAAPRHARPVRGAHGGGAGVPRAGRRPGPLHAAARGGGYSGGVLRRGGGVRTGRGLS